jgi:hypothetical protein
MGAEIGIVAILPTPAGPIVAGALVLIIGGYFLGRALGWWG